MKKNICKILWMAVFVLFCVPQFPKADMISCPAWQKGDRWLVKAVYPSPLKKNEWSAPVYWEYNVADDEKNYYTVEVRKYSGGLNLSARLTYAKDFDNSKNVQRLSLIKAEITKPRRGKEIVSILTYQKGIPVQTEQTLIPFDTPVFPLLSPFSEDFMTKKHVSQGLKVMDILRQEVRQVSGTEDIPDWPPEKNLTQVKLIPASDQGYDTTETPIFVQYWHENLPWPVFGRNRNMKYWLVEK